MDSTVMHINKGNAHGTQGERSNGDNSAEHRLLASYVIKWFLIWLWKTKNHTLLLTVSMDTALVAYRKIRQRKITNQNVRIYLKTTLP